MIHDTVIILSGAQVFGNVEIGEILLYGITILIGLSMASAVSSKEYTGGKWKHDEYSSYKDFTIQKGKTKYDVSV